MLEKINKPISPNELIKTVNDVIEDKQSITNLVVSLSAENVDTQYPSAKCVFDAVEEINTTIEDTVAKNLLQPFKIINGGSVVLEDKFSIYYQPVTEDTTFTFDVSNVTFGSNTILTFELAFYMPSVKALTFSNITWQDNEAPEVTDPGFYFFAFRSLDLGQTWIGNMQGVWPLEVNINPNFFAWTNKELGTVYTLSQEPQAGDYVFSEAGKRLSYQVVSYDLSKNTIEVEE